MEKVRETVGLPAPMNKIVRPTNLSNDKESLLVVSDQIEGGYGLPVDSHYILDQLHSFIKSINFWFGYNDILNNITPQVITHIRQACQ